MGPRIPECVTHSWGSSWSLGCPSECLSYFLPEHKLPLDLSHMAILQWVRPTKDESLNGAQNLYFSLSKCSRRF